MDGFRRITPSIHDLKSNIDARDFILSYLGVDNSSLYGRAIVTFCPFHKDKNKSFAVYDNGYYCFGCREHGDVFDFIANIENIKMQDAIRLIKEGHSVVSSLPNNKESKKKLKYTSKEVYDMLDNFMLNNKLKEDYVENEWTYFHPYEYITKGRGIKGSDAIDLFRMGYCTEYPDGKDLDICLEVGLARSEGTGEIYCKAIGSIIIPIINVNDNIVSLTMHNVVTKHDTPKYVNLVSSPNCKRGATLYGEHLINNRYYGGNIFLTEGYFDAASMYSVNMNALAVMGSCLNDKQLERLESLFYYFKFIIAFDGDDAGREGAEKTQRMLTDRGMKSLIFRTPNGKDVNDLVKSGDVGSLLLYSNF